MRSELSRCKPGATQGFPFVAIWGRDIDAWMGLHTHLGINWSWRHDPNMTALIALLVRICGSPARPECEHTDRTVFAESICGGWQIKLIYGRSLLEGALEWTDYIVEQSEKHHLWPDIAGKAFGVSQAIGRAARSSHLRFSG